MSENTQVGPAGSNGPALPITDHVTYGHTDDTPDGGMITVGDDTYGYAEPTDPDADFSGASAVGQNGVQPGNGAPGWAPMTGPVNPTGFDPGDNSTDGSY